ncbi:type VI secretion system tip protein VgrG [Paraburkholderia sp. Ac-20340]|uniref:type VI secretion system Vgr family protein n=1 Tax=Paraburkholderia sp. Ac-20340 TaxID=2703888 RepID=UPI00197FB19F|nr:type VI secretion system tip protein TssI/VgrG [Paraburkholderia sp. Ac-20340]MBN3856038.1 type VI secretion system tip protein VgrG [Paraburkholderia sp. Ac-20340]
MPRQSDVRFTFEMCTARVPFEVVEFELVEGLSESFKLTVELSSQNPAVDFQKVLDQPATLTIWRGETPVRYVNGVVSLFEQGATGFRRTRYRVVISPMLSRAELCSDWRIHQQVSIAQILASRIKELGITDYEQRMFGEHLTREYCVQPGETTWHFINRVAADEGIYAAYEFSEKGHRLIHGDRLIVHGAIGREPVVYNPSPGADQPEPCLWNFLYAENVRTSRSVSRDYTYRNPRYSQEHRSEAASFDRQGGYEKFHYPGGYKQDAAGKPMNQTRLLALRNDARLALIEGDDARLIPGMAFKLEGHPREEWNRSWRPVRMTHYGVQHVSQEEESASAEHGTSYRYEAEVIPDDVEWKPALLPRPVIEGPQTAFVTGPAGEEIYCDNDGRVVVQFAWDRRGRNDEHSTCWIRVAQNWAGATWGHMAIPRIGQEVLVSYLDGDPDQPIIIGRVYDALNLPPYELPRHKTRMTIKSQTHKGEGYNELRFEDEAGQEEIFVHAQKDQNLHVNHDETTFVGNDRKENVEHDETIDIGHDRTESVGNDEQVSIGRNRRHTVGQDASLFIERNHTVNVGKDRIEQVSNHRKDQTTANHIVDVGGHVEQTVQGHHRLSAGQSIRDQTQHFELKAGDRAVFRGPGGSITVDDGGITIEGIAITFKGPLEGGGEGKGNVFSFNGQPNAGVASDICLECLIHAAANGAMTLER